MGAAGGEVAQDLVMAVVVPGDRAAPGHVPGDVVGEQAAQRRGVVAAAVEGCLCLVEGLEQACVGMHLAVTGAANAVAAHRPGAGGPEDRLSGRWPAASSRKIGRAHV